MNTQQEITQQTNYNCSASGMSPRELRSTIVRIKNDSSLTETEKSRMIQELMTTKYREFATPTPTPTPTPTHPHSCTSHISFHQPKDGSKRVFGCEHYRRGCQVSAPCCDQFFVCRFCHDANRTTRSIGMLSTAFVACPAARYRPWVPVASNAVWSLPTTFASHVDYTMMTRRRAFITVLTARYAA